ncbi:VIT domain-containing protein [soil metagenome]
MRHAARLLVTLIAVMALPPVSAVAQERTIGPEPMEPMPPIRCDLDCWWPVGSVAQLDGLETSIEVADGSVTARYRFSLSNPQSLVHDVVGTPAEGRIVFPVPAGSSVTDLVLSGGPETLEGRLLDADEATRIYEEIVRRLIDPALLRSVGADLYEVRAFPVPAGEQRQVSFTVTTPLLADGHEAVVEVPWARMSPRPASAVVTVDVDVPWEVRSAIAPGFELDTQRNGSGRLELAWESSPAWTPDADFRLHLGGGEGLIDTRLLSYRASGEDGYFALLFAPVVQVDALVARDVVLVLDTSGSMEGEKMEQAIAAAEYVLDHLGAEDRFAIVDFSRDVRTFGEGLHPAADAQAGIDYVRDLLAGGNTNISGALEQGLSLLGGDRPGTVIFLTDGLPTAGIEQPDGILELARQAAPGRTQLFAFGVGFDVDTVLLDALSTQFVGSSHYVSPEERIDSEVQRLFERISTPVLTDLRVAIEGVETWDVAPGGISGIFAGSQALLTGRYEGSGPATVVVTGDSAQGPERFSYEVDFPERDSADPTVAQLWAQRRVADLLTELRIEGHRESLVEQIVDIATRFGIVTPFTAYLAEEPDMAFRPDEAARAVNDAVQAAPSSGEQAVGAASDLERLREGGLDLGNESLRVVGAHSYYLVDRTWVRDDFEPDTEAPEVLVGSAAFAELLAAAPEAAEAAALGERVVVLGPDGWVTLVWPEVDPED